MAMPNHLANLLSLVITAGFLIGCSEDGSMRPGVTRMVNNMGRSIGNFGQAKLGSLTRQPSLFAGTGKDFGNLISSSALDMLSNRDKASYKTRLDKALSSSGDGTATRWNANDSDTSVTMTPSRTRTETRVVDNANVRVTCRDLSTTVSADGDRQSSSGSACKLPSGTWQLD